MARSAVVALTSVLGSETVVIVVLEVVVVPVPDVDAVVPLSLHRVATTYVVHPAPTFKSAGAPLV